MVCKTSTLTQFFLVKHLILRGQDQNLLNKVLKEGSDAFLKSPCTNGACDNWRHCWI